MVVVVLEVSYSCDVFLSLVLLVDSVTKGKILLCSFYFCWGASFLSLKYTFERASWKKLSGYPLSRRCVLKCLHIMFWKSYNSHRKNSQGTLWQEGVF